LPAAEKRNQKGVLVARDATVRRVRNGFVASFATTEGVQGLRREKRMVLSL
jgi:hypothetical protein